MKQSKRVLLIDDDELILKIHKNILEEGGFSVFSETSSIKALERIFNRERFDIIVTDIRMAEMDGWALLDIIRHELNLSEVALPVIVVSAYDSSQMQLKSMEHQANAWFVKPIKPLNRLVEMARTLTGQRGVGEDKNDDSD